MVNQIDPRIAMGRQGTMDRADIDVGLRKYMLGVYNYMASGVLLTGLVAMAVAMSPALQYFIFGTAFRWVAIFAPLAIVMFFSFRLQRMSSTTAKAVFWLFAGTMGLSLGSIFLVYTGASIAKTFFVTAATFGALSLYGYTTKKDLSGWGTFLFMGLIGLILASIVNIFTQSAAFDFVISAVGVLLFAGLTAYDTQKIKEMYFASDSYEIAAKKSVSGALSLYLDFINLFLFLLRFMGSSRD
ncbi:Bax inhibitor-1/YccA family protein [Pedomonas mirosovicensis]|uniref:Bax inhibitor-1/YccA family protein n=1 Tax=Pedomonas mirosovicensis TaxID=2908641 RepID=UPI0021693FBC